jgi:hypothetical protein
MKTIRSSPKPKIINKKLLIKQADTVFSKYIRTKYQLKNGFVECYTCGKKLEYSKSQCGHFISRSYHSLRFDVNNARVQCSGCNVFKKGNYMEYTMRLIKKHGIEFVDALQYLKQVKKTYYIDSLKGVHFTDIKEVIKHYEKKLKEIQNV